MKKPRRLKVQFFRQRAVRIVGERQTAVHDWRWRIRAENGQIVGASSEGYRRRFDCGRNLTLVTGLFDTGRAEWVAELCRLHRPAVLP
jgi:hypothetical protein